MKSRKWGKFILTCVVLLWWLSMLREILAGKYNEGNISRGNIYVAFFCYCCYYFFSAALLCYNQSRHQPFQTVNNNEGLFFPLKRRKPSKVKNKKTILTPHLCPATPDYVQFILFALLFLFFFIIISFFFKWSNGLSRVQPDRQLLSTQLCCKSVNNRRARITVSLIQSCHRDVIYQIDYHIISPRCKHQPFNFRAPICKIIGKAHREKSLAHSIFHCSPPFLHVICTDRMPAQTVGAPVRLTLQAMGASRC